MGKFCYIVAAKDETEARTLARDFMAAKRSLRAKAGIMRTREASNIRITEAVQDKNGVWTITGTMTPNITEVELDG